MEVSGRKVDDILCEPCLEDGQKLLAVGFCVNCCEFLCSTCYKHHCIPRPCRHHVLQDKETMPRTKPDAMATEKVNITDKCPKHGGEIIKFYCRSDRQLGCGSCMTFNHRKCDRIVSIVEEYENFEKDMKEFGLQIDKNSETKVKNRTEIENIHSQTVKDIKLFMSEFKQFFESLENGMITDADNLKDKDEKKMESISATCMRLRNDLQSLTFDLSKLHKTQQNGKLFTMMEEARDQMKTIAKEIDQMDKDNKVEKYEFVPEKQIQGLIGNVSALGKLSTNLKPNQNYQTEMLETSDEDRSSLTKTYQTQTQTATKAQISKQDTNQKSTSRSRAKQPKTIARENSNKATNMNKSTETEPLTDMSDEKSSQTYDQSSLETPSQINNLALSSATASFFSATALGIKPYQFKPRQVSLVSNINVESSKDETTPKVTGIALLPYHQFVLIDSNNHKAKLVNTQQNKLVTELELSHKPFDITVVNNYLVAITLPYANQIQLLSVSNEKLSKIQHIKVYGKCQGIAHNNETFIVTYDTPAKLEIISMLGYVLKVIDKGPNGESLFVNPHYITLSPDKTHVYISDWIKHTVTSMTVGGKVKVIYKDGSLRFPLSLTVDKSGSVYVVCQVFPYYMHQISGDCSQGQKLERSSQERCPWSITYSQREDKLYVGSEDSSIQEYQLK